MRIGINTNCGTNNNFEMINLFPQPYQIASYLQGSYNQPLFSLTILLNLKLYTANFFVAIAVRVFDTFNRTDTIIIITVLIWYFEDVDIESNGFTVTRRSNF